MDITFDTDIFMAKFMKQFIEIAGSDGKLTEEEERLVSVTHDLIINILKDALIKAFEDGIITNEEEIYLSKLKDIIIDAITLVAEEDGYISKDELNLILTALIALKIPRSSLNIID